MKFSLRGKLKGRELQTVRTIDFNDGEITGDEEIIAELQFMAEDIETLWGGVISPSNYLPATEDMLEDEMAVVLLFHEICTDVESRGKLPTLPDLPEGAK